MVSGGKKENEVKVNNEIGKLKAKGKAVGGPVQWSNTRPGTGKVSKN